MYYVYEWYIVETGEVIYVGKGTKRRYKVRKHNKFFDEMIRRYDCDSRIVKEFESERDAFDFEYTHVKELKQKGQCVCNIYDGGFGGTTDWWTDELREHYSRYNVMKSEKQRERMSEHNPMKDKALAEKVNSLKKRPVIIGDKQYESIAAARAAIGVPYETIALWCKKGINAKGEKCRFAGEEYVEFTDKRYNKGGCKAVVYKGVRYESIKDLAHEMGLCDRTISEWLKRGFDSNAEPCRYENDDRELIFVNRYKQRNRARSKPFVVNGVRYQSVFEASDALGIKPGTLRSYATGARINNEYICKYDNQQPSQGNVDKSTLEGSETNG